MQTILKALVKKATLMHFRTSKHCVSRWLGYSLRRVHGRPIREIEGKGEREKRRKRRRRNTVGK